MHDRGKSDDLVVPAKPPNNAQGGAAEAVEGRGSPKENATGETRPGRRAGHGVASELGRVRQLARGDKDVRFSALLHHVDVARLRVAYLALRPKAAPGVDGVTWHGYGQDLLGFSYGFRPGRSPHHALDALATGIQRKRVNWVLDLDFRDYFSRLDHRWLERFVEHRIADRRVLRLIQQSMAAGVIEDGSWTAFEEGVPQGASVSPLLANIYAHYVFDLWAHQWRRRHARGDVVIVRFADDAVVGFEHRDEAERFWAELRDRLARFGLELNAEKTRLIGFGRFAASNRQRRGPRKPETVPFLGFTPPFAKNQNGR